MNRRSLVLPAAVGSVLLTMLSLMQVFDRQRWFVPSLLAVAVAFGAGWGARRLDVPGVLAPAVSLLAMLTLLGIVFVRDTTAFGLPTATTMRALGEALSAAGTDIRESAPPAEATDALTLLATAGVFVVAMIVDWLVFWLRRPVAAGMPLLALFLIPASIANKANVFSFVLAAFGYLFLLVAEGRDRARSWGRRLSGLDLVDEVADVSHVARVGRRIGTAAVGIALCVPIAVPTVGKGIFDGEGGGILGRGKGSSTLTVINPIVQIKTRLQDSETHELLNVVTDTPEYLRLTSLDQFDGTEWSLVKREVKSDHRVKNKEIPMPPEMEDIQFKVAEYRIDVGDLAVAWLPVPYAPSRINANGDWRYEDFGLSVFSTEVSSRGIGYVAEARLPQPSVEQLRAPGEIPEQIKAEYLAVPQPTPQIATDVLAEVTEGKETQYDRALALNEYFFRTGGFVYDLNVASGNGIDSMQAFLTRKRGYCEQFAAAMAYLSRLAGIPARVVVGFTPGAQQNNGTYRITNKDAHAWPELYFPNAGWVRFEPTPRTGTIRPGYVVPPNPAGGGDPTPEPSASAAPPTPTASASDGPRGRADADEFSDPGNGGLGGTVTNAARRGVPYLMLALALAAVALASPSVVAAGTRRRRRRLAGDHVGRIHAAWESLADAAEDVGYPLRSADSPRGAARRLVAAASLDAASADEVGRLAAAEERARYARTVAPYDGLDAGVRSVRKAMVAALPWRARLRASVLPASAVRRIRDAWRSAVDGVDAFRDRSRARVRAAFAGVFRRRRTV